MTLSAGSFLLIGAQPGRLDDFRGIAAMASLASDRVSFCIVRGAMHAALQGLLVAGMAGVAVRVFHRILRVRELVDQFGRYGGQQTPKQVGK